MMWLWLGLLGTAEANERAKELYLNGKELYNQGRYEQAITAWTEAYDLDPAPLLLLNLSNAYERSGDFEKALEALQAYRPYAKPEEGEVTDDRIRAFEDRVRKLREERELAEQERIAREKALEEERRKAEELRRQQELAAQEKRGSPVVPVVVTAAGLGMLGFGTVQGLAASSARQTLKDPAICTVDGLCKPAADDAFATQRRAALLADVGLITGTVVTATGVALLVRSLTKSSASDRAVVPVVGLDGSVGVNGAF
jgi:tetratricopeptide (TPR) repeat protein